MTAMHVDFDNCGVVGVKPRVKGLRVVGDTVWEDQPVPVLHVTVKIGLHSPSLRACPYINRQQPIEAGSIADPEPSAPIGVSPAVSSGMVISPDRTLSTIPS